MITVLVRDLLFSTKITSTARALNLPYKVIRDPAKLPDATPTPLLLVDLNLPGSIPAASAYALAHPQSKIIAFVSHTDAPTISAARSAGITHILARSAFVQSLPDLLQNSNLPIEETL